MGELLLKELHQRQNLPVLELLAWSVVRNDDYPVVIDALEKILNLLPLDDLGRKIVQSILNEAQKKIK